MTPPPPFAFGNHTSFEKVQRCLPASLRALAANGPALLGLEAPVVVAAGLAHLAASLGRAALVTDGVTPVPSCFNLAMVSDAPIQFDWLSALGAGWIRDTAVSQAPSSEQIRAAVVEVAGLIATRGPGRGRMDPQFAAVADKLPFTLAKMVRRRFISSSPEPAAVMRSIVDSNDHCALLVNGSADPMKEWSSLSPGNQQRFAQMLTLGWLGKPLPLTPAGEEIPAVVHVIWLTREDPVRRALFDRHAPATNRNAPVLLFRHHGTPRRLPEVQSPEFIAWSRCLKTAFDYRNARPAQGVLVMTLDEPVRQLADSFYSQFSAALNQTPPSMHPYLHWLPDLVLRLYAVLAHFSKIESMLQNASSLKPAEEAPDKQAAEREKLMISSIWLTHWLCQEHYKVVCSFHDESSNTPEEHSTDSTDMTGLKDAILTKLRDKGPQAPRELQRCFHHLRADDRNKAIAHLKSSGLVVEKTDGRLEAVG